MGRYSDRYSVSVRCVMRKMVVHYLNESKTDRLTILEALIFESLCEKRLFCHY